MSPRWNRERIEELYREYLGDEEEDPAKRRKRARILKAATELFIANGYRKTSVDEIARRAEVAKGTVYLYFPNKGQLLVHAIALEKRALIDILDPILSGTLPERERLRFWVGTMLTVARELPLVARLMREDGELTAALEDIDPAQIERSEAQGQEWIMELLELAAPGVFGDDDKRLRADVLLGLRYFAGILLSEQVRGGRTLDQLAGALADMLVYGAVNRPPEETEG